MGPDRAVEGWLRFGSTKKAPPIQRSPQRSSSIVAWRRLSSPLTKSKNEKKNSHMIDNKAKFISLHQQRKKIKNQNE
jgi:hypothetical protein